MDLKRILVAINSLNDRDAAFVRALALARLSNAELYVLHAVPVDQRFSFRAAERLERMANMRKRATDAGVPVHTVEQHGDAAEIIELHANARAVDLVVIGGEARDGWGRGRSAIAEKVIRRTNVPTLVVGTDAPDSPTAFRNVLVAIDLSPGSTEVLRGAIGLTAPEAVQLTLLHSVKGVEAAGQARQTLEAAAAAVPAGVHARVQVSTGSAERTILEYAVEMNADLVVVGRSRGFKMLGSTALHVLRRNDRALLVIPSPSTRRGRVDAQRAA